MLYNMRALLLQKAFKRSGNLDSLILCILLRTPGTEEASQVAERTATSVFITLIRSTSPWRAKTMVLLKVAQAESSVF